MNIPTDKILHFYAGMIVFNLSMPMAYFIGLNPVIFCTFIVFLTAIAKEFFDFVHNEVLIMRKESPQHSIEFMDVVATMLGAVPSIIFLLV